MFHQSDVHSLCNIDRDPRPRCDRISLASHRQSPPKGPRTSLGWRPWRWLATVPYVQRTGICIEGGAEVAAAIEHRYGADRSWQTLAERRRRILQREVPG